MQVILEVNINNKTLLVIEVDCLINCELLRKNIVLHTGYRTWGFDPRSFRLDLRLNAYLFSPFNEIYYLKGCKTETGVVFQNISIAENSNIVYCFLHYKIFERLISWCGLYTTYL